MDKDKQRIAIAEACGWTITLDNDGVFFILRRPSGEKVYGSNIRENLAHACPDYLNDLNVCHDVEMAMSVEDYWFYCDVLLPKTVMDYNDTQRHTGGFLYSPKAAPAFLRARCILEMKNLWTPTGEENEWDT